MSEINSRLCRKAFCYYVKQYKPYNIREVAIYALEDKKAPGHLAGCL